MSESPSSVKKLSEKQEKRLLEAGKKLFASRFPNPERIGCPRSETLKQMASRKLGAIPKDFLDHLTCCSPCFVEYQEFLDQARRRKRLKTLVALAGIAATFIIALGLFWFAEELTGTFQEESLVDEEPAVGSERVAVLDLRNTSPQRGEASPEATALPLPRDTSRLRIYLPIGSGEGDYEVQLVRSASSEPIVHADGTAQLRNQNILLEVDFPLATSPGRYLLGIRRTELSWTYHRVNVEN